MSSPAPAPVTQQEQPLTVEAATLQRLMRIELHLARIDARVTRVTRWMTIRAVFSLAVQALWIIGAAYAAVQLRNAYIDFINRPGILDSVKSLGDVKNPLEGYDLKQFGL